MKLELDIVLRSDEAPGRDMHSANVITTIQQIINAAFQARLPEYDVEIVSVKAEWPGAPQNFSNWKKDKR